MAAVPRVDNSAYKKVECRFTVVFPAAGLVEDHLLPAAGLVAGRLHPEVLPHLGPAGSEAGRQEGRASQHHNGKARPDGLVGLEFRRIVFSAVAILELPKPARHLQRYPQHHSDQGKTLLLPIVRSQQLIS